MRSLILLLILLTAFTAWAQNSSRGPTEEEKRKDYPDAFIYDGAPFCCIYIGLDVSETGPFCLTNFWKVATQYDIHRPKKYYEGYSGPPLATCKNDHVAVFEDVKVTQVLIKEHDNEAKFHFQPNDYHGGVWSESNWPTNACRITKGGREVLAEYSGTVKIVSIDQNYPPQDFKKLCEAFVASLRSLYPDRTIRVYGYYADAH